jgi:fatty acid desaturase
VEPSIEESTPLIELAWWEKILFPNLNFTLHIYHHWYPTIPFSKLPMVHLLLKREGLIDDRKVFHGYMSYLRFLFGRSQNPS